MGNVLAELDGVNDAEVVVARALAEQKLAEGRRAGKHPRLNIESATVMVALLPIVASPPRTS